MSEGLTKAEAVALRKQGATIHGCWMCIFMGLERNQWREDDLKFIGHKIFCPKHYNEQMLM